jgi:hypothetical protein
MRQFVRKCNRRQICLDSAQQSKIAIMMHFQTGSSLEQNTKVVENFLRFPMGTYTPQSDKQIKSYNYQKTAHRHKIPAIMNT